MPEIIRAVREQFYRGASHIKLMAGGCMSACDPIETVQFTAEEMKAACDVVAENMPPKDEMICRAEERATEILNWHEIGCFAAQAVNMVRETLCAAFS